MSPTGASASTSSPALQAERRAAIVRELRRMMTEQSPGSDDPLRATIALAALDAIFPTAVVGTPSPSAAFLSPAEQRVAASLASALRGVDQAAARHADPAEFARVLSEAADAIHGSSSVRITHAGLCRRVESFGRYEPFPTSTFLAGRAHKAIVYVELDRFASRPPASKDGPGAQGAAWVVELTQELELIHDADGRRQWYRPPQAVVDASMTRRRDFYLVNTIDLPATLTVGAYSLKVTVRDKTTAASDERVIPVQIIADPSALTGINPGPASR